MDSNRIKEARVGSIVALGKVADCWIVPINLKDRIGKWSREPEFWCPDRDPPLQKEISPQSIAPLSHLPTLATPLHIPKQTGVNRVILTEIPHSKIDFGAYTTWNSQFSGPFLRLLFTIALFNRSGHYTGDTRILGRRKIHDTIVHFEQPQNGELHALRTWAAHFSLFHISKIFFSKIIF